MDVIERVKVNNISEWDFVIDRFYEQHYHWTGEPSDKYGHCRIESITFPTVLSKWEDGTIGYGNLDAPFITDFDYYLREHNTRKITLEPEVIKYIKNLKADVTPAEIILNGSVPMSVNVKDIGESDLRNIIGYILGFQDLYFEHIPEKFLLWRKISGMIAYFCLSSDGMPSWTMDKDFAMTGTEEEMSEWKTPFWKMDEV